MHCPPQTWSDGRLLQFGLKELFKGTRTVEKMPTGLQVVAAAIRDAGGRLLLQQRPVGKHHGGLWEFPGGKVEQGESHHQALIREIAEELAIRLEGDALGLLGHRHQGADDGERALVLFLYNAPQWAGHPCGLEGQRWGWFEPAGAASLPLAPLDRQLLQLLA